jgi:hypothetical protein
MKQITGKRLFVLLVIPLLLIPTVALSYAHFTDDAAEKYILDVAFPQIEICSCKVLSRYDGCLINKYLKDTTLTIQTRVFPGWFAWIGLIIHNCGQTPISVSAPTYSVYDPNHAWQYFTHKEYFYGPYDDGQFATANPTVWDSLSWSQLPPKPTPTPPPILLAPSHKVVLWIKLVYTSTSYSCNCYCKQFTIKISITIQCTPPLKQVSSLTWPP